MPKTKYPGGIDTSVELPAVRDNILESGSDVINSLRSAIFQIEKTLGINPQGAVGNSVADRIGRSLDDRGNIKKDALGISGVLSGPVINSDVSKSAAIEESKLRLDFPTNLLQDEISILSTKVSYMISTVEGLNALLSAHVHKDATGRHLAKAIALEEIDDTASSEATMAVAESETLQNVIKGIYESHINYDGSDISAEHRSHDADQIFFDNTDVADIVIAEDVQNAIEDVANATATVVSGHQSKMHSNSIIRSSDRIKYGTDIEEGLDILDSTSVSFQKTSHFAGESKSLVTLTDTPSSPDEGISKSDILAITNDGVEIEYQISDVTYSTSEDETTISKIKVFGQIPEDSSSGASARIFQGVSRKTDLGALMTVGREERSLTSSKILQVANPASVMVVSSGISPYDITSSQNSINVSIDGTETTFSLHNSAISTQTIDSIINKFNEKVSEDSLSILAYRVDMEDGGSEMAIVHNLPNTALETHTLKVSKASDDGINPLGFSHIKSVETSTTVGNYYYLNGIADYNLGSKIRATGLNILDGTTSITAPADLDVDFELYGIYRGDILIINGSDADDGTYEVKTVETSKITVSQEQIPTGFSGELDSTAYFSVYKNSVSLEDETFDLIDDAYQASLFDIFMDKDQNIHSDLRLAYTARLNTSNESIINIVDFKGDVEDKTLSLKGSMKVATDGTVSSTTVILTLDDGDELEVDTVSDDYRYIKSGTNNVTLKLYILDSADIVNYISSAGVDFESTIKGQGHVNADRNLALSRVAFNNFNGRISGSKFIRTRPLLRRGAVGIKDVGTDVKYYLQERVFDETRYNGVTSGLQVTDVEIENESYKFNLSAGVCYVKGRRFELDAMTEVVTNINSNTVDKFFIAIDEDGNLIFSPAISGSGGGCSTSLDPSTCCMLVTVENSDNNTLTADLRIFISDIDLSILNSITVSPHPGMGHFKEIKDALHYAKRFSEVYPKAGTPTIHLKSGTHEIVLDHSFAYEDLEDNAKELYSESLKNGIWIDFPVNITGEGDSTVIDIARKFTDVTTVSKTTTYSNRGRLYIVGAGLSDNKPAFSSGISSGTVLIKDLKMSRSLIEFIDPVIYAESAYLRSKLVLDNITFDFDDVTDVNPTEAIQIRSRDSATTSKGNISITNCKFIDSYIYFIPSTSDNEFYNINISNNILHGGEEHYLLGTSAVSGETIFSFNETYGAPVGNNIEIRGNIHGRNFRNTTSGLAANITSLDPGSGIGDWGDRVNRRLDVGGRVRIFGAASDVTLQRESGALVIYDDDIDWSLCFDSNDIQAKSDPTTANSLYLNTLGGDVYFHSALHGAEYDDPTEPQSIVFRDSGKATFGSAESDDELAKVSIITDDGTHYDYDPLAALGQSSNYQLLLNEHAGATSTGAGIAFSVSTHSSNVGAAIIHKRTGGNSQGSLGFYTKASTTANADPVLALTMTEDQYVGIGTDSPLVKLDIRDSQYGTGNSNYVAQIVNTEPTNGDGYNKLCLKLAIAESTADSATSSSWTDKFLVCTENDSGSGGTAVFYIDGDGGTGTSFTGQHWAVYRSNDGEAVGKEVRPGMILSSSGVIWNKPSINQALPMVEVCSNINSKSVYGVLSQDYNSSPSNFYLWSQFDEIFNTHSMKSNDDTEDESKYKDDSIYYKARVNSLGEGQVWVTNINGDVENGDYISSSEIAGYGMLQEDGILHNYTVAKCTEAIDWGAAQDTIKHNGTTYKKYLCACTYHCG